MIVMSLSLALQQAPAPAQLAESPVARIVVTPATPVVTAGDTLRLAAQALDAGGRPVANASIRFFGAGARFEARVDPTGLVRAGAPGVLPVRVVATVPGARPSAPATIHVRMVARPAAAIAVSPAVSRLLVGQRVTLRGAVTDDGGEPQADAITWSSSAPRIARVEPDGRLVGVAPGRATITATAGAAREAMDVTVAPNTIRRLEITGGAAEARTGDVLRFGVTARDLAGRETAPPLPAWSVTPGSALVDDDGAFVAHEPGIYTLVASLGSVSAEMTVRIRARDARRPTRTVGRLPLGIQAAEFWPHPDGRHAYLSTSADRLYALDISDPAGIRITDSLVVDARHINDVQATPDGRLGVMTREGASSRRNGIVILDLADPAHPRVLSEYTETVSGGVHSIFLYHQPRFGLHCYLTDDATGSLRVIDLSDPRNPREVARWQPRAELAGNYVHDLDIEDGLAYLAYWNDGLIVLDIGNGMAGGTPTAPRVVSQLQYDLDALYRDVEAEGGFGFIRGTHTAWREGRYVFIADEVFTARPLGFAWPNRNDLGKANGRVQVVDVSDIRRPRIVAHYESRDGGAHNVWVAGDTLLLGDYQGGLKVIDISGELRGDLRAQGREIAHVHTGDARGVVPNAAMAWGAFYVNGLVWVNDMFSGLWAIRIEPREQQRVQPAIP